MKSSRGLHDTKSIFACLLTTNQESITKDEYSIGIGILATTAYQRLRYLAHEKVMVQEGRHFSFRSFTPGDQPRRATYLCRIGNRWKIGETSDLPNRMSSLTSVAKQIGVEAPTIKGVFHQDVFTEKMVHNQFAHLRSESEYFYDDQEITRFLEAHKEFNIWAIANRFKSSGVETFLDQNLLKGKEAA